MWVGNILSALLSSKSKVGKLWQTKVWFTLSSWKSFLYFLKVCRKQRRFIKDNTWLAKPKVFTIWPFSEGSVCLLFYSKSFSMWAKRTHPWKAHIHTMRTFLLARGQQNLFMSGATAFLDASPSYYFLKCSHLPGQALHTSSPKSVSCFLQRNIVRISNVCKHS